MKLEVNSSFKRRLYDLYFREACEQEGWAYIRPEEILAFKSMLVEGNAIPFSKGVRTIDVVVMQQLVPEIIKFCQRGGSPFDYLACKAGNTLEKRIVASPTGLSWTIIRQGGALFSERQAEALAEIRLPLTVFKIRDVLAAPRDLEFRRDTRTGSEWLDMLDELKEEEEYDDEFF